MFMYTFKSTYTFFNFVLLRSNSPYKKFKLKKTNKTKLYSINFMNEVH